jgi:hypothetical protein
MYYKPEWYDEVKRSIISYLKSALECPVTVGRTKSEIIQYIRGASMKYSTLAVEVALDSLCQENIVDSVFLERELIDRDLPDVKNGACTFVDVYYLRRQNV